MIYLLDNSNFHEEDGMIGQIKVSVEYLITPIINLRSIPVHSLPQLPFGFSRKYQPIKGTHDGVHYVFGFTRQVLEAMCRKRTFGYITWERIVGNKNTIIYKNLSVIFLASLLVFPMLGCRHSSLLYCNISRVTQVECTFSNILLVHTCFSGDITLCFWQ